MTSQTRNKRQILTRGGWTSTQVRGNDWVWAHSRYKRSYSRDEALEMEAKFVQRQQAKSTKVTS
jgi:hypothetical protein